MLYSNCGFLGFGKGIADKKTFENANYEPDRLILDCGFLGFSPKRASFSDIPNAWKKDCVPAGAQNKNANYVVTGPGECGISGCRPGFVGSNCVQEDAPCETSNPRGMFRYDDKGACKLHSCKSPYVLRPDFQATGTNAATCPAGYRPITNAKTCEKAARKYQISTSSPFSRDMKEYSGGCVVHASQRVPAKVTFNTNKDENRSANAFLICERDDHVPCVSPGSQCNRENPAYKWSTTGHCIGSCAGGGSCIKGEKCCGNGRCIEATLDCPKTASAKASAENLANMLKDVSGAMQILKKST